MFRKFVKRSYGASGCKLVQISESQKAEAGHANLPIDEDMELWLEVMEKDLKGVNVGNAYSTFCQTFCESHGCVTTLDCLCTKRSIKGLGLTADGVQLQARQARTAWHNEMAALTQFLKRKGMSAEYDTLHIMRYLFKISNTRHVLAQPQGKCTSSLFAL